MLLVPITVVMVVTSHKHNDLKQYNFLITILNSKLWG